MLRSAYTDSTVEVLVGFTFCGKSIDSKVDAKDGLSVLLKPVGDDC